VTFEVDDTGRASQFKRVRTTSPAAGNELLTAFLIRLVRNDIGLEPWPAYQMTWHSGTEPPRASQGARYFDRVSTNSRQFNGLGECPSILDNLNKLIGADTHTYNYSMCIRRNHPIYVHIVFRIRRWEARDHMSLKCRISPSACEEFPPQGWCPLNDDVTQIQRDIVND
jgi:hypothetical protein